jgi:hypothetical protein
MATDLTNRTRKVLDLMLGRKYFCIGNFYWLLECVVVCDRLALNFCSFSEVFQIFFQSDIAN